MTSINSTPNPTQDTEIFRQLSFLPGLKELLMVRQVHALEHATVWVLDEMSPQNSQENDTLGGLSTDQGFYLYGDVHPMTLQRAANRALQRLKQGEDHLAVHPRCGTNVSVSLLLTTGFALGTSFLLPRRPIEQIFGVGLAAITANQLAPDLGKLAQKYLTTAIPFNLTLGEITHKTDFWGNSTHFVQVHWVDVA